MKKIIIILFLATLFFKLIGNTYAGCFEIENMDVTIHTEPNLPCLEFHPYFTCVGSVEMSIESSCKDQYYLLNSDNTKYEFSTSHSFPYNKTSTIESGTGYYLFYNIPNDFTKWEYSLVNLNNSNDIVKIQGNNTLISFKNIENGDLTSNLISNNANIINYRWLIIMIFTLIIIYSIYKKKTKISQDEIN